MRLVGVSLSLLLFQGAQANLVDDIITAIKNAGTCVGCHGLVVPLQGVAALGDTTFSNTLAALCKALNILEVDICDGIMKSQGPVLAHGLRSINPFGDTTTKLCDAAFGLCQAPAVNPYKPAFPKPAPKNPKAFVSTGKAPFKVVHFSDIHIDRKYSAGADSNCSEPICCRPYTDVTQAISVPAGAMGSHRCDTPTPLVHNLLQSISQDNKFAIFTGDVVEGLQWQVSEESILNSISTFNAELSSMLGIPIYPAIGNHESFPADDFPRNTTTTADVQWVFDAEGTGWAPLINATAAAQAAQLFGSYSKVVHGTNLKIISINTVYWYKMNFWLYDSDQFQPDPNGLLAFTIQELQAAEDAGQRVWIVGHMHPSGPDALNDPSNYYDQIVQRYRNTIAGQFFGHSHQDEFGVAYSNYNNPSADTAISVSWLAPSITPRESNSAFKVYEVDPDTYEVMDARVLRTDMSNPSFQSLPTWELYYSARDTYGPLIGGWPATTSLNPAFWHKVTEAFEKDDAAFKLYQDLRFGGFHTVDFDADSKKTMICDMRASRGEDRCSLISPGLNLRRRQADGVVEKADKDCDSIGLGHIFSQLNTLSSDGLEALRTDLKDIIPNA